MTRIGWLSAFSFATTGYGKVTKEVCSRLVQRGVDVVVIGGFGGNVVWGGKIEHEGILNVPTIGDMAGKDVIDSYIKKYDISALITLWDAFVLEHVNKLPIKVATYLPIDASMTTKMFNYVRGVDRYVAMSRFGYKELLRFTHHSRVHYIPHGVDTKVYRPNNLERMRMRDQLGVRDDEKLVLSVCANVGERKMLPFSLRVFKEVKKKVPEAKYFLFSNPSMQYPRGYDLIAYCREIGLEVGKDVMFPEMDPIVDSWLEKEMAALYNAADVYFSASFAEGFGLPLLEAMACGTPVVAVDGSTTPELVGDRGWIIKTIMDHPFVPVWIPTLQEYYLPSLSDAITKLADSLQDDEKREIKGKECIEFARKYEWDDLMIKWGLLLEDLLNQEL